jgi:hypothetical protein
MGNAFIMLEMCSMCKKEGHVRLHCPDGIPLSFIHSLTYSHILYDDNDDE